MPRHICSLLYTIILLYDYNTQMLYFYIILLPRHVSQYPAGAAAAQLSVNDRIEVTAPLIIDYLFDLQ